MKHIFKHMHFTQQKFLKWNECSSVYPALFLLHCPNTPMALCPAKKKKGRDKKQSKYIHICKKKEKKKETTKKNKQKHNNVGLSVHPVVSCEWPCRLLLKRCNTSPIPEHLSCKLTFWLFQNEIKKVMYF